MLVKFRGCTYCEDRAETAPRTKKGASGKVIMADASDDLNAVDSFKMRHFTHAVDELNRRHLRLKVTDEEFLDSWHEQIADEQDHVLQHGVRISKTIGETMFVVGRSKYMNEPSHSGSDKHAGGLRRLRRAPKASLEAEPGANEGKMRANELIMADMYHELLKREQLGANTEKTGEHASLQRGSKPNRGQHVHTSLRREPKPNRRQYEHASQQR